MGNPDSKGFRANPVSALRQPEAIRRVYPCRVCPGQLLVIIFGFLLQESGAFSFPVPVVESLPRGQATRGLFQKVAGHDEHEQTTCGDSYGFCCGWSWADGM